MTELATMPNNASSTPVSGVPGPAVDVEPDQAAASAPDVITGPSENRQSDETDESVSTPEEKPSKSKIQKRMDALCRQRHEAFERADLAESRLLQEQAHVAHLVLANQSLQRENAQLLVDLKAAAQLVAQFRAELSKARTKGVTNVR